MTKNWPCMSSKAKSISWDSPLKRLKRTRIKLCLDHQSFYSFVGICSPPRPLSRKRVCPPLWTKGGGQDSLVGEGSWGANSDDWRESLALCGLKGLCHEMYDFFEGLKNHISTFCIYIRIYWFLRPWKNYSSRETVPLKAHPTLLRETCHGNSPSSATSPPTIRPTPTCWERGRGTAIFPTATYVKICRLSSIYKRYFKKIWMLVGIYLLRRLGRGSKEPESDSFLQLVRENKMSCNPVKWIKKLTDIVLFCTDYRGLYKYLVKEGMLSNNKLKRWHFQKFTKPFKENLRIIGGAYGV